MGKFGVKFTENFETVEEILGILNVLSVRRVNKIYQNYEENVDDSFQIVYKSYGIVLREILSII